MLCKISSNIVHPPCFIESPAAAAAAAAAQTELVPVTAHLGKMLCTNIRNPGVQCLCGTSSNLLACGELPMHMNADTRQYLAHSCIPRLASTGTLRLRAGRLLTSCPASFRTRISAVGAILQVLLPLWAYLIHAMLAF